MICLYETNVITTIEFSLHRTFVRSVILIVKDTNILLLVQPFITAQSTISSSGRNDKQEGCLHATLKLMLDVKSAKTLAKCSIMTVVTKLATYLSNQILKN